MAQTKSKGRRGSQSQRQQPSARKNAKAESNTDRNGSMLESYFMDALKDIYWAEKALTKALPRMSKAATSKELKKAFDQHLAVTEKQIGRLDKIFEQMGKKAQ